MAWIGPAIIGGTSLVSGLMNDSGGASQTTSRAPLARDPAQQAIFDEWWNLFTGGGGTGTNSATPGSWTNGPVNSPERQNGTPWPRNYPGPFDFETSQPGSGLGGLLNTVQSSNQGQTTGIQSVGNFNGQVPSWFDAKWYLDTYKDVANSLGVNDTADLTDEQKKEAYSHYVHSGMGEGRAPSKDAAQGLATPSRRESIAQDVAYQQNQDKQFTGQLNDLFNAYYAKNEPMMNSLGSLAGAPVGSISLGGMSAPFIPGSQRYAQGQYQGLLKDLYNKYTANATTGFGLARQDTPNQALDQYYKEVLGQQNVNEKNRYGLPTQTSAASYTPSTLDYVNSALNLGNQSGFTDWLKGLINPSSGVPGSSNLDQYFNF